MLFTDACFFPWLALALMWHWSAPADRREGMLLLISLLFWLISSLQGSVWLLVLGLITWWGGRRMAATEEGSRQRRWWLRVSLLLLISALAMAKYGPRLQSGLLPWVAGPGSLGGLPLGLSYYTFHSIGYLLEIYWGKQSPMRATTLGLYLSFFPKAVMGPICRSAALGDQLAALPTQRWNPNEVAAACGQITAGLFLKCVLADRLLIFVEGYHDSEAAQASLPGALAAVLFCWQLYYDFFGYSLMAVGTARLFGLQLPNNFQRPFYVTSISDFWSRWHISLSGWFQEYFYTPLRFHLRRRRTWSLIAAGMATFLAIGVWHGTGWTFVVLGALHGVLVTVEALWPRLREVPAAWWRRCLKMAFTFGVVAATLVLFRAPTLSAAAHVYAHFFSVGAEAPAMAVTLLPKMDWLLLLSLGVLVEWFTARGWVSGDAKAFEWVAQLAVWPRAVVFALVFALIWIFGIFRHTTFLYNQF